MLRLPAALVAAFALMPAAAHAATFDTVPGDGHDAAPGNGTCATAGGLCTLRAAVEEANALPGQDRIDMPAGTFTVGSRIAIADDLILRGAGAGVTTVDGGGTATLLEARTEELLVCDSGNDSVQSYDRNGVRNGTFVSGGSAGLDFPMSITKGPDDDGFGDDLFVTGFQSGIHRYDVQTGSPQGTFIASGASGLLGPTDAAFGPEPFGFDLFVTKYQPGGGVLRFDRTSGAFEATTVPGVNGPNSLAFHDGALFVTSAGGHTVLRRDSSGVSTFVSAGSGGLNRPRDLAFKGGSLYVASEETDSVLRYSATTGAFQGVFVASGSGGLDKPTHVEFGPDGDLLVLSSATKRVLRYRGTTGAYRGVFLQGGTATLDRPSCLLWRQGVGRGPNVSISRLTLANGRSETGEAGPGLYVNPGADATLADAVVRDHRSSVFGGGLSNFGRLAVRRTEVRDNALPEGGGGQTSQGGGIFNNGNLTVDDSLITDNFATRGGGLSNLGRAEVTNTTISGNRASGGGGGIRNATSAGNLLLNFVTITGNQAQSQNASGESNRFGGGILNLDPGRISMANSILAGNTDARSHFDDDFSPDCWSQETFHFTSHRSNVVGVLNDNCSFRDTIWGNTVFDQVGTETAPLDPRLGPLASNGGPTRTHALLTGSPARDADTAVTSASFFDCPGADQRDRPRPGGDRCDAGAFEVQSGTVTTGPSGTPTCDGRPATIVGTNGPDVLVGTSGQDVIWAGGGDDEVSAGGADDRVCGGAGEDTLRGQGGIDRLWGGADDDTLEGGNGDDRLFGEGGDDVLDGGPNNDHLDGGPGTNVEID